MANFKQKFIKYTHIMKKRFREVFVLLVGTCFRQSVLVAVSLWLLWSRRCFSFIQALNSFFIVFIWQLHDQAGVSKYKLATFVQSITTIKITKKYRNYLISYQLFLRLVKQSIFVQSITSLNITKKYRNDLISTIFTTRKTKNLVITIDRVVSWANI